jgi:serine/threonine-protein kinase RsbW
VFQTSQLQVSSNLDELGQVLAWFAHLDRLIIPRATWIQCQTALAEGFTNAVRHAHKDKSSDTHIEIEVSIRADALEIRIWDWGAAFDLDKKLKSIPETVEKDSIGGRGLGLLKQISDRLSYIRTVDDRNCLIIVKNYSTSN